MPANRPAPRLPSFSGLRAFEAVVRHGGVRQAAKELGVDHSVVSRQLRSLQDEIGVDLIQTSHQGVELSDEARAYAGAIAAALGNIVAATKALQDAQSLSTLTILCVPAFASKWLMPRLRHFWRAHPTIEIVLKPAVADRGFASIDADVLIDNIPIAQVDRSAMLPIAAPRAVPVASAAWIARQAGVVTPADLVDAPLIHEENLNRWRAWFRACGVDLARPLAGPRIGQSHLALEAAKQEGGVVLLNAITAERELAGGVLREVGNSNVCIECYVLMRDAAAAQRPAVARFHDWLHSMIEPGENRDHGKRDA